MVGLRPAWTYGCAFRLMNRSNSSTFVDNIKRIRALCGDVVENWSVLELCANTLKINGVTEYRSFWVVKEVLTMRQRRERDMNALQ